MLASWPRPSASCLTGLGTDGPRWGADEYKVSSLHITFNTEEEWRALEGEGFLSRIGLQYHWVNRDYTSFEDFLAALKQSKRKSIRQVLSSSPVLASVPVTKK